MIVEEIFEKTIFPSLKNYIETNSIYNPTVVKKRTQESKIFPIITAVLMPVRNKFNNLSYGEQTYSFGITIDCYAVDKIIENNKISKRTICYELVNLINNFFTEYFHVTIKINLDNLNVDSNVHRSTVNITGRLDTKYENKTVIYPI